MSFYAARLHVTTVQNETKTKVDSRLCRAGNRQYQKPNLEQQENTSMQLQKQTRLSTKLKMLGKQRCNDITSISYFTIDQPCLMAAIKILKTSKNYKYSKKKCTNKFVSPFKIIVSSLIMLMTVLSHNGSLRKKPQVFCVN